MRGEMRVRYVVAAMVLAMVGSVIVAAPAGAAPAASTPINGRIAWARTNGDILAITKVEGSGAHLIAFGGNFTAVITPDGASHAAKNFAVVDEFTGALVYAGNADSYVRAISSRAGTIYVGGSFSTFGGVSRSRLAALSPSFTVTSWNPSATSTIRAVLASAAGVYYGGEGTSVKLANLTSGATVMSQPTGGGSVRSLALSPDSAWLYVGGGFETYGGLPRHGLIRANSLSGVPDKGFNANFRADSGVGTHGSYDGEAGNVLRFNTDGSRLLVGVAGYGSDEFKVLNPTTGAKYWQVGLPGDGQGVGVVGSTYVVGYHRHDDNPWPYFAAQVEASNGALTNWDPGVTGFQSNADGGNNGVQAIYVDPVYRRVFLAGAFTSPVKSLAVYTWGAPVTPPPPNKVPTARFTASAQGLAASFDGSTSSDPDGSITSWAWTFGDGTTGTGATAQHTYAAAGTYPVTLKVTDDAGATATASASLTVSVPVTPASPPPPPPADRTPIGQLLIANLDRRSYGILGYAIDPDTDAPIQVAVDVAGVGRTVLTADYRLDGLPQSHPGYGPNHGFLFRADLPAGTRDVCVYAIGANGGGNTLLGCNRVTVK